MRIILISLLTVLFSFSASAQIPINDGCSSALALGTVPACPTAIYTNINATETNIGKNNNNFCTFEGNISRDVWFTFRTSPGITDYNIKVIATGNTPIKSPNINMYRGSCSINGLAKLCIDTVANTGNEFSVNLFGLTPNITYFIRVSDTQGAGTFQICATEYKNFTISNTTATSCSGQIFDSGGADKNYGKNENFVFKICPTEPHKCIKFTLNYYQIDNDGDRITFFNGADINAPVLKQIKGEQFSSGLSAGGAAYTVYANATCLTMQFKSDSLAEFRGFDGQWQCLQEECPKETPIVFGEKPTTIDMEKAVVRPGTNAKLTRLACGTSGQNYATFNAGDNSELGLGSGIVLSSGSIFKINQAASENATTPLKLGGDFDLDSLSKIEGGSPSKDACIAEFEVYAATDELSFEYVFASEEYPDFISDSKYFDIFALMIEGSGITGDDKIKPKKNLAVLPNGTPISIGQVNYQSNYEYYRNNLDGTNIVYNGMTTDRLGVKKTLTARSKVTPCNTYRLKMAIADRGDDSFDSGVFIGDIKGATPNVSLASAFGLDYLIEKCSGDGERISIKFDRPSPIATTYQVQLSGTATRDVDYTSTIPNVINVSAGAVDANFSIKVLADNITENDEYIEVRLLRDYGCGLTEVGRKRININDNVEVKFDSRDTILVCNDFAKSTGVVLQGTGAASYQWIPNDAFNTPQGVKTRFSPKVSGNYYVKGTVGVCSAFDTIYAKLIMPTLELLPRDSTTICEGKTITFGAKNNFQNQGLLFVTNAAIINKSANQITLKPNLSDKITVSASVGGCDLSVDYAFKVNRINMPPTIEDTTVCSGTKLQMANFVYAPESQFIWSPAVLLDPKKGNVTYSPTKTQQFVLKGTAGQCTAYDTINIKVLGELSIKNPDTLRHCIGASLALDAKIENGAIFNWSSPNATFEDKQLPKTTANLIKTGWIYASAKTGTCNARDSIYVILDSLPKDSKLQAFPQAPFYCPGDTILLYSGSLFKNDYPDAVATWQSPVVGAITTIDKPNLKVIVPDKTTTYIRYIKNNSCERRDTFVANVIKSGMLKTDNLTICAGSSAVINVEDIAGYTTFEWTPSMGLSCSDCARPTASKGGVYKLKASKSNTCSAEKEVIITEISNELVYKGEIAVCKKTADGEVFLGNQSWAIFDVSPKDGVEKIGSKLTFIKEGTYTITTQVQQCRVEKKINISIEKLPEVKVTATDYLLFENDKTTLKAEGQNYNSLRWSTNEITPSINIVAEKILDTSRLYIVVAKNIGCEAKDSIRIYFARVPTIFAPDSNPTGNDDNFRFLNLPNGTLVSYSVFDRWGNQVFKANENIPWNGTKDNNNADELPSGVYVFVATFEVTDPITKAPKTIIKRGDITLIR